MNKPKQYVARPTSTSLPELNFYKDSIGVSSIKLSNLIEEFADCLDRTSGVEDYLTEADFDILDKAAYVLRHFSGRFPK